MNIQQRMLIFITRSNWVLFGIISVLGAFLTSSNCARGMICGGLMVTVNFHMLYRTLNKALTPPYLSSHHVVIAKYYVRFVISGIIIFLLISKNIVDPVGLIIGLSVVVASFLFATFIELKKMIFKE